MSTFDAGSIDAKLTLDRSSFTRGLREARRQADEFERQNIELRVDYFALNELRDHIERLSRSRITIDTEITGSGTLDHMAQQVHNLSGLARVNVEVNSHGLGSVQRQLYELRAMVPIVDVQVNVDIDRAVEEIAILRSMLDEIADMELRLKVDVDNIDEVWSLQALMAQMDPTTIKLKVDTTEALVELATLEALIHKITMNVDVDATAAFAKMGIVEAAAEALDGKKINLRVGVTGGGGRDGLGHLSRMQAIVAAIVALAPLIPAVIAPATAAVVGLGSALAGAAGGLGVLGLGVGSTVMSMLTLQEEISSQQLRLDGLTKGTAAYNRQAKIVSTLQAKLNSDFGVASTAIGGLKEAWGGFQEAVRPTAMNLIADTLNIVSDLLPRLTPIFETFGSVASGALKSIGDFISGPEGARMLFFFQNFGAVSFGQLLSILGNLTKMFGRLFEAFGPFATLFLDSLVNMTARWAEWADGIGQTKGFQDFINYVTEMGPRVWNLITAIVDAFLKLGEALAPLAGPALTLFTGLFNTIANAPTGVLTTLITLFGGLYLAFVAVNAAFAISRGLLTIWTGLTKVASAAQAVWTGVQWAWNAAVAANPIGLIILAIAALVAGLIFAYQHFEGFRKVVDTVVGAVVGAFKWLYDVLLGHSIIPDIINGVIFWFNLMTTPIRVTMEIIKAIITFAWTVIKTVFMAALSVIRAYVSTAFTVIATVIRTYVNIWRTIISAVWSAIKVIFSTAVAVIKAIVTGNFSAIPGIIRGALGQLAGIAGAAWSALQRAVSGAVSTLLGTMRGLAGRIKSAVGNLGSVLIGAGRAIIMGLITGIGQKMGDLGKKLGSVGGFIKDHKGPESYDKIMLRPAGKWIMDGLIKGIDDMVPSLDRSLGRINNRVMGARFGGPGVALAGGGTLPVGAQGGVEGGRDIQVTQHIYNPVAEKSSETAVREISTLGALGVFG